MDIFIYLFTAFYLKTNDQNKIFNQEIEGNFCTFVNYQHENWTDELLRANFVATNNKSSFTKLSPFLTLKSLHLYISFDVIDFLDITICKQINKKKAMDILEAVQSI